MQELWTPKTKWSSHKTAEWYNFKNNIGVILINLHLSVKETIKSKNRYLREFNTINKERKALLKYNNKHSYYKEIHNKVIGGKLKKYDVSGWSDIII